MPPRSTERKIEVKDIEQFSEKGFNLKRVAELLSWKVIEDTGVDVVVISRENYPHLRLMNGKRVLVVAEIVSSRKFNSSAILAKPESIEFNRFTRTIGRKTEEIRSLIIFGESGGIVLSSETPHAITTTIESR